MKARVVTHISITGSAQDTFRYLTHLNLLGYWSPHLVEVTPDDAIIKLGSHYKTTSRVLGMILESENSVTKYQKNKQIQIENTTGLVHYVANFTLEPGKTAGTVILKCATTVSSDGKAFAFTAPMLRILAKHELQVDLEGIKSAVEGG